MKKLLYIILSTLLTVSFCIPAMAGQTEGDTFTIDQGIHVDSSQMADESTVEAELSDENALSLSLDADETVIVVDAGHGGYDIGSTHLDGTYESDKVLQIALYLKEELETYTNTKVILTRSTDTYVSLTQRTQMAANAGADCFVCLHTDYDSTYSVSGASIFYPNSNYRPDLSAMGRKLADNILSELVNIGTNVFQGCTPHTLSYDDAYSDPANYLYPDGSLGDYYSVIRTSKKAGICGILVEHGFGSSSYDFYNFFSTNAQLKALAIADAKGIAKTFSLTKEPALPKEFVSTEDGWYYMAGDKVINTTDIVYGTIDGVNAWWFINEGKVDLEYKGVEQNSNGWWYVEGGKVNFDYTGFASNKHGDWYIEKGKVNFNKNDIIYGDLNGESAWWLVEGSKIIYGKSTVAHNANGWWYVGPDGKVDFDCCSVEENSNGWWYIKYGKVDFSYTGIAQNKFGWWRIVNGKVDFNCNSVEKNEYGWFYIRKGKVDFSYTGIANNSNGWWRIEEGKVNFAAKGIYQNENGWWYVEDGKVNFSYNGSCLYQDKTVNVVNGKADIK